MPPLFRLQLKTFAHRVAMLNVLGSVLICAAHISHIHLNKNSKTFTHAQVDWQSSMGAIKSTMKMASSATGTVMRLSIRLLPFLLQLSLLPSMQFELLL